MGFSRQEYWDELPCPLPGGLPKPGVEPKSPTLQVDSLPAELPGKPRTYYVAAAAAKSLQLCPTLCGPIDSSPSGCAIPGILQARTLEWVAISFSNQCMKVKSESEVAQSSPAPGVCSNLCPSSWWCHPTISSSVITFSSCLQSFPASGSFPKSQFFTSGGQSIVVHGILQARILEWVALPFSRRSSQPRYSTSGIAGRFFTSWATREA